MTQPNKRHCISFSPGFSLLFSPGFSQVNRCPQISFINRFNGFFIRALRKPLKRFLQINRADFTRLKPGENERLKPGVNEMRPSKQRELLFEESTMKPNSRSPRAGRPCHSAVSLVLLLLLAMLAAAVTAIACSWRGSSHSVRFNDFLTERGMGCLPPLPTLANGLNEARAYWEMESGGEDYYETSEKNSKEIDGLWDRAATAEKDGNLKDDQMLLSEYLKATGEPRSIWFEPTATQERRNSATDRLDALAELGKGAHPAAVKAYLEARRLHETKQPEGTEIEQLLVSAQANLRLKDNVAYLRAAEEYRQENFAEAAAGFRSLLRKYPHSEKREAALFMTAVATMKDSVTYLPATGNADYDSESESTTADDAWHEAFASFQRLISEYPRGKYFYDAQGWQAYLLLRRHDRAGALVRYYRLLNSPDEKVRTDAAFSLMLIRSS